MLNLMKVEFYKLKNSKTFYSMIFLNLLQAILVYTFSGNFKLMNGRQSFIYMCNIQSSLMLYILIGLFASNYIVIEFTSGYIKNLIAYGHKRTSIFISKSIVYYVGIIIICFIAPLIMTGINIIKNGYGEALTFNSLSFILKMFLTLLLIYVAIGSINVLAAFTSRNANITVSVIIVFDFINRAFNITAIQKPALQWLYTKIIFSQPGNVLADKAGTPEIWWAVIASLITLVITNSIGIYIFKKADIK